MITEKDFKRIGDAFDVHPRADEKYFELAKKMAIEFGGWIFTEDYHVVVTEHGGKYWTKGIHGLRLSTEQLFELYQQSKV
jgi:hypothetical protein